LGQGRVVTGMGPIDTDEVFHNEWPSLWRLAFVLTNDRRLAEDLAQEAFTRWYERRESVDNPAAFLRTVVTNLAHGALRRRSIVARWSHLVSPRESGVSDETPEVLSDVLALLSVKQRAVIVMRFYERRTEAEIAEILGCKIGTVKSITARSLAVMRRALDDDAPLLPPQVIAPSPQTLPSSPGANHV
jgi:RNA polymerase sigma factor (sigma-70 family)